MIYSGSDLAILAGQLIGFFAIGYIGGLLLLLFKRGTTIATG